MRKSQLRKYIREIIRNENKPSSKFLIERLSNGHKVTLGEIETAGGMCISGGVTDMMNPVCKTSCPCTEPCHCVRPHFPEKDRGKQVSVNELHKVLESYPNKGCGGDRKEYLHEIETIEKDPVSGRPYASQCKEVADDMFGNLWLVNCNQICRRGADCGGSACDCWW